MKKYHTLQRLVQAQQQYVIILINAWLNQDSARTLEKVVEEFELQNSPFYRTSEDITTPLIEKKLLIPDSTDQNQYIINPAMPDEAYTFFQTRSKRHLRKEAIELATTRYEFKTFNEVLTAAGVSPQVFNRDEQVSNSDSQAPKSQIKSTWKKKKREQENESLKKQLEDLLTEEDLTQGQIMQKLGINRPRLINIASIYKLKLSDKRGRTTVHNEKEKKVCTTVASLLHTGQSIDDIIKQGITIKEPDYSYLYWAEQGLSLREIGDCYGVSGEQVRLILALYSTSTKILSKTSKERITQQQQDSKEILKTERASLITILKSRTDNLWNEIETTHGWAGKMTRKFYDSLTKLHPSSHTNFNPLINLLNTYKEAKERNEQRSLAYFSMLTGFSISSINRILKVINLEPMYGNKERMNPLETSIHLQFIKKACEINLSIPDITYFSNQKKSNVSQKIFYHHLSKHKDLSNHKEQSGISIERSNKIITIPYRYVAEALEAYNAGFSTEETCTLFEDHMHFGRLTKSDIAYIQDHKESITTNLTTILTYLYGYNVQQPYEKFDVNLTNNITKPNLPTT